MKDEAKKKFCQEASEWRIRLTINANAIIAQYSSATIPAWLDLSVVIPPQIERSERELCEQVHLAGLAAISEKVLTESHSIEGKGVAALKDADCIHGVLKA